LDWIALIIPIAPPQNEDGDQQVKKRPRLTRDKNRKEIEKKGSSDLLTQIG
jgi:hypothetical protein